VAVEPEVGDSDEKLWSRVGELADRPAGDEALFHHRLAAIAAQRARRRGARLSAPLAEEERYAAAAFLAVRPVLDRVLEAVPGPVMVFKGPEVACRYPDPTLRPHHDLDLLVEDSAAAHAALLAAGCELVWDRPSTHHELPVAFPDLPVMIELHHAPKLPPFARPVGTGDLLAGAVPSRWDARLLAPSPAEHAVLVAGHAWVERPLRRLLDLVDVELLLADTTRAEAAKAARRWGVERMWTATLAAADAILADGPLPWTVRSWARNLPAVRERTRREELLERALAPFAALPPGRAALAGATALARGLNPRSGESLTGRLRRGPYEHPALSSRAPSRVPD
jgi:hypothetical protein